VFSELDPASRRRHKVHPLTWVAAAALMPLLAWDVWRTLQDVKQRHQPYASVTSPAVSAARPGDHVD
jgi:hypothetical protein